MRRSSKQAGSFFVRYVGSDIGSSDTSRFLLFFLLLCPIESGFISGIYCSAFRTDPLFFYEGVPISFDTPSEDTEERMYLYSARLTA